VSLIHRIYIGDYTGILLFLGHITRNSWCISRQQDAVRQEDACSKQLFLW